MNYGGSTGYGREYRERLRGAWGVVDTVDCVNAARFLVERGDADPERVAIRGGSAGGYTTLNALTRFDFFSAGGSLFGLADLETFATGGTHKFESRYLDSLLGPYPEKREVYRERSPIDHVDDLSCPVILLQGLEDVIVPPAAGGDHRRGAAAQGSALRLPRLRGRAARLPQGGEHHPRPGGRAVLLRARVRLRPGRRDRAGRDREPGLDRLRVEDGLPAVARSRRDLLQRRAHGGVVPLVAVVLAEVARGFFDRPGPFLAAGLAGAGLEADAGSEVIRDRWRRRSPSPRASPRSAPSGTRRRRAPCTCT